MSPNLKKSRGITRIDNLIKDIKLNKKIIKDIIDEFENETSSANDINLILEFIRRLKYNKIKEQLDLNLLELYNYKIKKEIIMRIKQNNIYNHFDGKEYRFEFTENSDANYIFTVYQNDKKFFSCTFDNWENRINLQNIWITAMNTNVGFILQSLNKKLEDIPEIEETNHSLLSKEEIEEVLKRH
jgi:hypothetical protein